MLKNTLNDLLMEWRSLIDEAQKKSPEILKDEKNIEKISYFLKVNERLAFSVGYCYIAILMS